MIGRLAIAALLIGFGYAQARAAEVVVKGDLFVATDGKEENPGTREKPFATLSRARDAVRGKIKAGLAQNITVLVRGGTYELTEPLAFGPEDSGTEKFSITYAAFPGEKPVFSGGRRIAAFKPAPDEDGLWVAEVPEAKNGKWVFRELFVGGQRRQRARFPAEGFLRVEKSGPDHRTSFTYRSGDLKKWDNPATIEVMFYHDWSISRVPLASIDEAARDLKVCFAIGSGAPFYSIDGFEPHPRYYLENHRAFLTAPGNWFLDASAGRLYYRPLANERPETVEAIAPFVERLLLLNGGTGVIRNLHFKGIGFQHQRFDLPPFGYTEGQAGFYDVRPTADKVVGCERVVVAPAVEATNCVECSFEDCRFEHLGGSGLLLRRGCHDNRIIGCAFMDISANGVMVGDGQEARKAQPDKRPAFAADPEVVPRKNAVENCLVDNCGVQFKGAVGIYVGIADGTVVAHNEIRNLPYTGVSLGWMWNPDPTPCANNRVEFNHIHHVMQELSDGGGIYTLGRQPGTVLRGNDIHDIPANAGRAESNGMFLDEGSSLIAIEENHIHAISASTLRYHKALKMSMRRNRLVVSHGKEPYRYNACSGDTMTFEGDNIERMAGGKPAMRFSPDGKMGRALLCDGISSFMEAPHQAKLDSAHLTVEAWVRPDGHGGGTDNRRWLVNKNSNEWQDGHYALIASGGRAGAYLNIGGGKENSHSVFSDEGVLEAKVWRHLVMTYDGSDLCLYVDGKPAAKKNVAKPRRPGSSPLAIGRRQDGFAGTNFQGLLDEVRIYDRVFPAEHILARAQGAALAPGAEPAGYWSFDEQAPPAEKGTEMARAGIAEPYRTRLLGAQR